MNLPEKLAIAHNEKDVENTWRSCLEKAYKCSITSPLKVDGYFEFADARVLCEFKHNTESDYLPTLSQAIYYLKQFRTEGMAFPSVVLIGDIKECFIFSTSNLIPYLTKNYDWNIAPSLAWKNLRLMADLKSDENIIPIVFPIDNNFNIDSLRTCIQTTALQHKAEIPITRHNIRRVFEYWCGNVIKDDKLTASEVVNTFLTLLCQPHECFIHPKKSNTLVVGEIDIKVSSRMYKSFFSLYKETHNPLELRDIVANKDRLMIEILRRRTGAFFTPSLWVDEAHKMLAEQFGEDWKDKYIVWDCSCGTMNLTRDYKFKELYCSTLDQSDLDTAIKAGYNPEAVKFQFDFLNDNENKLPETLKLALKENKPIIFFNNPPYGTFANLDMDGTNKSGIAETKINELMYNDNMGNACKQLYTQFLYRIIKIGEKHLLTNFIIATFSKANFMTGGYYTDFRKYMYSKMTFNDGMLFQASHFADVASSWGVSFTIFKGLTS